MNKQVTMPRSRSEQLVIQDMPEETLVYDLDRHKAHCLNRAAAAVWQRCDGRTPIAEVAQFLRDEMNVEGGEEVVWLALNQLSKAKLLDEPVKAPVAIGNPARRELMKRVALVGGAAMLLPAITSIIAPTAVSAATCQPSGSKCNTGVECCSGFCTSSTKKCL
jgi:hypothetical protein